MVRLMHWTAKWGERTACGKSLQEVARVVICSRSLLTPECVECVTCEHCKKAAAATMYSVAPP